MTDIPPPTAAGYQPAPGEGITEFSVRASRSVDYQTGEAQLSYSFPAPRSFAEALPIIDELQATVDELAYERAKAAADQKAQANLQPVQASANVTQVQQPPVAPPPESPDGNGNAAQFQQALAGVGATPVASTPAPGQPDWRVGTKPQNRGTFKFLSTASVGLDAFKAQAQQAAAAAGIPTDQVVIYDDRGGQYGLETAGNTGYSAGKIKAADGSQLAQVMEAGRTIVGYVDFNDDGTLKVGLSKDGQAAVQALKAAAALVGQA